MKVYIGMKVIKAEPMTKGAFANIKGEKAYETEASQEGYLVEYPNPNGAPNYQSWSPKDVFERAYREIYPDEMNFIVPSAQLADSLVAGTNIPMTPK